MIKKTSFDKFSIICNYVKAILFFFLISLSGKAQVFWTEDFNNGCTNNCVAATYSGANGAWTVASTGVEGADFNNWYVSCAENGHTAGVCGTGCVAASATATLATLHVGSSPAYMGDIGAAYNPGGFCGVLTCAQTDRRAESPTIDCSGKVGITLGFNYIANGDPGNDFASIEYSIDNGASWLNLTTPAITVICSGQGQWTAFTYTLPATCDNNPNVKIAFRWVNNDDGAGTNPSFAVDDMTLSVTSTNTITTGTITGSAFCACTTVDIPFTSTGTFTAGNNYTSELSDASGSFATPVIIGTLASTSNSGTILGCVIPCNTPSGTGYRIRVVSSSPVIIGTDNGADIIIGASVVASVNITASPGGTICTGQSVTFTATPANGGSTPTYQWQLNNTDIGGEISSTYSTAALTNGDTVTCIMTSNAPCVVDSVATSNTIIMVVTSSLTPSVVIVGAPTTVCAGDPVTFTATPTNEGNTPNYQWQVNGINAGTNSSTFISNALTNGASVTVILTSSSPCASPTTALSNTLTITVNNCNKPVADFSGTPRVMCQSGCVTFTDLSTNSPTSWSWQFPGASPATSTSQNPTNICYSSNGSYDVTLIVSNSSGADTLTQVGYITVGDTTQVNIIGNLLISSCEKAELTAVPSDGTYSWGPDVNLSSTSGATVTAAPQSTQQYWVTYTSPEGCTDSDTVTVVVTDINTYFLPTALTPNGDGINDEIHLHGRSIESFTLKIFDRIGEQVFQTTSMEKGWDGRLLGVPMNDGVFVYTLNITFCNGEKVKKYGDITLVK